MNLKETYHQIRKGAVLLGLTNTFGLPEVTLNGSVFVLGNKIYVTDPDDVGSFATIVVPDDKRITVMIDGRKVVGETIVSQTQDIQVLFNHRTPKVNVSVTASDDRLSVIMNVAVEPGEYYSLADIPYSLKCLLEVQYKAIEPSMPTVEELMQLLAENHFQGEVDRLALLELSQTNETIEKVVLRGKPPQKEIPPCYKPVTFSGEYDPLKRNMKVSSVSLGQTVARFEDLIPGIPGFDVWGNYISEKVDSKLQKLGPGVTDLNGRIVALRSGRLVFNVDLIDVVPELVIDHDLSPKDGHIVFDGDVIIRGSILDGSFVKSSGIVRVHGGVYGSTIIPEQGLDVSGAIINSKAIVGYNEELYIELKRTITDMITEIARFGREYRYILENANIKMTDQKLSKLPIAIFEKRFQGLNKMLEKFCKEFGGTLRPIDSKYARIESLIKEKWIGIYREKIRVDNTDTLIRLLDEYLTSIETSRSSKQVTLRAESVTSSSVRSNGDIDVHNVYSSTLESGNKIEISGNVRGGFITSESSVRIYELGTQMGVENSVRVKSPDGIISIRIAHPNSLLDLCGKRRRIQQTEFDVELREDAYVNTYFSRR